MPSADKSQARKKSKKAKTGAKPSPKPGSNALRSVSSPKQRRSEATLNRLLDAAEKLICEQGLAAMSIAALVSEAGSSVGGFYARFRDKDALLQALNERQLRVLAQLIRELTDPKRWQGVGLEQLLLALVTAYENQVGSRERLTAAFVSAAARNPDAWSRAIQFRREVVDSVVGLILLRKDEIRHPSPENAARFAIQQAFSLNDIRALYAHTEAVNLDLPAATIVREIAWSMYVYLTTERPGR